MRGVFQATIVDDEGSIIPNCNIEARSEETGELVQLYDAFEAGGMLGNPLTADVTGFTQFYMESGLYRIRAYLDDFERIWRHVLIGIGPLAESGSFPVTLTGFSGVVSGTIQYRRVGSHVRLYSPNSISGTSNSDLLTLEGIPTDLQPVTPQHSLCGDVFDFNAVNGYLAMALISEDTITFELAMVSGSKILTDSGGVGTFTNSGNKGLRAGWSLEYDVQ